MIMDSNGDFIVSCLDPQEELEPTVEELDALYKKLEGGETIELSWKCPGRRLPTPDGEMDANSSEIPSENE